MSAWEERGAFRVRVLSEDAAASFRGSARAETVEIEWNERVGKPTRFVLWLASAVLGVAFVSCATCGAGGGRQHHAANPALLKLAAMLGIALFIVTFIARWRRRRDDEAFRKGGAKRVLRITPTAVELDGETSPRDAVYVALEEHEGRHRAVYVVAQRRTVLYESHHDNEPRWLVARIREALSR